MDQVILNVDLGEGEAPQTSNELIKLIGAANIACGGHAGSTESMKHCLDACLQYHTLPGAHPGIAGGFGRGEALPTPQELTNLLESQWARLENIADAAGTSLHHIKLHGSLYMAVESDSNLADAYLRFLSQLSPAPVVFCLAGGTFSLRAKNSGLEVWPEIFADRHYQPDGSLRSRSHPNALITDPIIIEQRLQHWLDTGHIKTWNADLIELPGKTICLHSDTPQAMQNVHRVHHLLAQL